MCFTSMVYTALLSMTGTYSSMEPSSVMIAIFITAVLYSRVVTATTLLNQKEHKTPQAAEKANDLSCFVCDSMDAGERCSNLNTSGVSFIQKCRDDRRTCMVKRYSYSTSIENSSYPSKHLWSLQRNCINKCEPGCIVIGERTKLYACTACCEKSLCNTMNDAASHHQHSTFFAVLGVVLLTAFTSWTTPPSPRPSSESQKYQLDLHSLLTAVEIIKQEIRSATVILRLSG